MRDAISNERLRDLHPILAKRVERLDAMLAAAGDGIVRLTHGLRSWTQQDDLYAKGRTTHGAPCVHDGVARPAGSCETHPLGLTVTKTRGGYSTHQFGLAGDLVPDDPLIPGWQPDWTLRDATGKMDPWWQNLLVKGKACGLAEGIEWRSFPDAPHFYPEEIPATPTDEMRQAFLDAGTVGVWEICRDRYALPLIA